MRRVNRLLLEEVRSHWPTLILITFAIVVAAGFDALAPLPFRIFIDNVLGNESVDAKTIIGRVLYLFKSREALGLFAALSYCLIIFFGSLAEYFTAMITKKFGKNLVSFFSQRIFSSLVDLKFAYYKTKKIGNYIYNLSYDASALGNFVEAGLIPLLTNVAYILITIIALVWISPPLSLISLAMVPILVWGLKIFNNKVSSSTNRSELSNSAFISFIEEVLNQIKTVHAFNQEKKESEAFSENQDTALTDNLNTQGWTFLLDAAVGIVIAVGYSVIMVAGLKYVFAGTLSTGAFIIFFFYLDNLVNPLMSLMNAFNATRENYVKINQVADLFEPAYKTVDEGTLVDIKDACLSFRNVSFEGENNTVILDNISFDIPAGKKTAIIGVSGSGKTTIANLILRFFEPTKGEILIGKEAHNIRDYKIPNLRDAIAYVPQELVLFNDSILNNVKFGRESASESEIQEAIRLGDASGFVKHLPQGYNFHVGTEGSNLSGGQRQRILLSRAFLKKDAKILILDEPISALDIKTREELLNNLDEFSRGKTTIFISNILEVVNRTDYFILINQGKVVHAGASKEIGQISNLANLILKIS